MAVILQHAFPPFCQIPIALGLLFNPPGSTRSSPTWSSITHLSKISRAKEVGKGRRIDRSIARPHGTIPQAAVFFWVKKIKLAKLRLALVKKKILSGFFFFLSSISLSSANISKEWKTECFFSSVTLALALPVLFFTYGIVPSGLTTQQTVLLPYPNLLSSEDLWKVSVWLWQDGEESQVAMGIPRGRKQSMGYLRGWKEALEGQRQVSWCLH